MYYVTQDALAEALQRLTGTAGHMLKIWLVLKQMGMADGKPVTVTTTSPTEALRRLFEYGHSEGELFVPFAHTDRYKTMKADAARSIVQTNIRRWLSSGSVVTVDPTAFLHIREPEPPMLTVEPSRIYPQGLGHGENGFAVSNTARVSLPLLAFGIWYYRQTPFAEAVVDENWMRTALMTDLSLTPVEMELIFVPDKPPWTPLLGAVSMTDAQVYETVMHARQTQAGSANVVLEESLDEHLYRIKTMVTTSDKPSWLTRDPVLRLQQLLERGAKAVLLYGPPRTGKTHAIDRVWSRSDSKRETIQIHQGWGYDELVLGLRPLESGGWKYAPGPLLTAIQGSKQQIVLEEINRTDFTQAIGEVFSLIEDRYRGPEHSIRLKNGSQLFIPLDIVILLTMNTLDRSTEDIDDALLGRTYAVEFPPRVEALQEILTEKALDGDVARKWCELFVRIQDHYPLGHGYFGAIKATTPSIEFYVTAIRPVLQKRLANHRDHELAAIDELVNTLFG